MIGAYLRQNPIKAWIHSNISPLDQAGKGEVVSQIQTEGTSI